MKVRWLFALSDDNDQEIPHKYACAKSAPSALVMLRATDFDRDVCWRQPRPLQGLLCCIHIGYNDDVLLRNMLEYGEHVQTACVALGSRFKLVVTTVEDDVAQKTRAMWKGSAPSVFVVENRGVDALGFLAALHHHNWGKDGSNTIQIYSHALKLHSKSNNLWRQQLAIFVHSIERATASLDLFNQADAPGMVASASWSRTGTGNLTVPISHFLCDDLKWFESAAAALPICHTGQWSGGSFWAANLPMLTQAFGHFDIEREKQLSPIGHGWGPTEGRLHYLERAFGLACARFGMTYMGVG